MSKLMVFTLALIAVAISQALSAPAPKLRGSDLSDTCLKAGFAGDAISARGKFMCGSNWDFRNASFRGVDLSGVNFAHADLAGADVTGAAMLTTAFNGTDLSRVKGLNQKQLDQACGDSATKVPAGLKVHYCA